ncbi:hypothetical protein BH20ACI2_BH20ACI2_28680 [soil metagenome]
MQDNQCYLDRVQNVLFPFSYLIKERQFELEFFFANAVCFVPMNFC